MIILHQQQEGVAPSFLAEKGRSHAAATISAMLRRMQRDGLVVSIVMQMTGVRKGSPHAGRTTTEDVILHRVLRITKLRWAKLMGRNSRNSFAYYGKLQRRERRVQRGLFKGRQYAFFFKK